MASNDDKFPPEETPNGEPIEHQNLAMGQADDVAGDRRFPDAEEYPTHPDNEYTDYSATSREEPGFDDPDRLPWLDTADSYEDEGMSPMKLAGFVLGMLALIGLIAGGIWWLQNRNSGVGLGDGTGELIAAPEGDYKVKPADAQGRDFEGEGDVAQATADGRDVTTVKAATPGQATPIADAKGAAAGAAATAGTGLVQLGAFADTKSADQVWATLGTRFAFLSGYQKKITTATVEGRQVVRLNAVTADADAAQKLCAQLKAAGGDCLIPR
jgi:SPOR domain